MSATDTLKHVHFLQGFYNSNPTQPKKIACVDRHSFAYYQGTGQCCAANPTNQEAWLTNPWAGKKYWKTMYGKYDWNVHCK